MEDGLDSLVLEKLLALAQELHIILPATEDSNLSSLQIARCLQAHLHLQRRAGVAARTGPSEAPGAPEDMEDPQVCALVDNGHWRKDEAGRQGGRDQRRGTFSCPRSSIIICYDCGLPGHIVKGCCAVRGRLSGPTSSSTWPSSTPGPPGKSRCTIHSTLAATSSVSSIGASSCGVCLGQVGERGSLALPNNSWPHRPSQWSDLAHRVVAAVAGCSAVVGTVQGVGVRVLIDTGASATIISEFIFNILPKHSCILHPVAIPCFAANGGSLGIIGQITATGCIGDIQLTGPVLVLKSLAVPCLLGTDFLGKMFL
ncbi:uncharacterized protein LOC116939519 [Petromyzon marinus]|uniref:uncharacterized protein LOC116939519 n=1 Tax=Petromyzon marinus TaxID=7757 RepID=UPI003F724B22